MFLLRGIAIALTCFVLLYSLVSLAVAFGWRLADRWRVSPRFRADLLFWLRIAPLLTASTITLALIVPAYVRLEPRSIEEEMALPAVLSVGCLLLFALGIFRVVKAQRKSARVVESWMTRADSLDTGISTPAFQTANDAPPLTLVGVFSPKVVVSRATVALLETDELRVAMQHEVAHMRFHDNLKKLLFYCSPFPHMSELESAWAEAAEVAADEEAVTSLRDALDLAAALIKLARQLPPKPAPAFTMALLESEKPLIERIRRLLAWRAAPSHPAQRVWKFVFLGLAVTCLLSLATYLPALIQIHRVTEWLVL